MLDLILHLCLQRSLEDKDFVPFERTMYSIIEERNRYDGNCDIKKLLDEQLIICKTEKQFMFVMALYCKSDEPICRFGVRYLQSHSKEIEKRIMEAQ